MTKQIRRHAVLRDERIYWIMAEERKIATTILPSVPVDIAALWWLGQKHNVSHFWIYPGSEYDRRGVETLTVTGLSEPTLATYDVFATYEDSEKKEGIKFARIWKVGDSGHQVLVGYSHRGRWGWKIEEPLDILVTVEYLERELCTPLEWGTTHVGRALLEGVTTKVSWLAPMTIDTGKIPYNHVARDFMFIAPLSQAHIGQWMHGIDKNGAHGNAMRDLQCGIGDPEHIELNPHVFSDMRDRKEAGIYHIIEIKNRGRWNGRELPVFLTKEWCTTEMLNFAIEHDCDVRLSEGWIFHESHRMLGRWANKLWNARTLLGNEESYPYSVARQNARKTAKTIMLTTGGSLASPYDGALKRPDWYVNFVGRARVIQGYNILSFEQDVGLLPVLIYSDAMFYVSLFSDIEKALPVFRRTGLGGYKPVLSVQVTPAMVDFSQSTTAGKMLTYVRKEWEKHGK